MSRTHCKKCGIGLGYKMSKRTGLCVDHVIPNYIPFEQREKYFNKLIKNLDLEDLLGEVEDRYLADLCGWKRK